MGAERKAEDTRPISLKDSSNKTLASLGNSCLREPLAKGACPLQRGFISRRVPALNVIELDAAARQHAFNGKDLPGLVLFDFAAAFPSVAWCWMFAALRAAAIPESLLLLIKGMYEDVTAGTSASDEDFLFFILSGVLQGCPLSGSIFCVCIDPMLWAIKEQLVDTGLARVAACADDIGAAISSIRHLVPLHELSEKIRLFAALVLKPAKCFFIPTHAVLTDALKARIKDVLHELVPSWSSFRIEAHGVYLGWAIGPGATASLQWRAAIQKFSERVEAIAFFRPPAHFALRLYGERAVPVLGYLPQFGKAPAELRQLEVWAVMRAMAMPTNALTLGAIANLHAYGGPPVRALANMAAAVPLQLFLKHRTFVESVIDDLARTATERQRPDDWAHGRLSPRHWETEPIAAYLLRCARGQDAVLAKHGIAWRGPASASRRREAQRDMVVRNALAKLAEKERGNPQRFLTQVYASKLAPDDTETVFARRCVRLMGCAPPAGHILSVQDAARQACPADQDLRHPFLVRWLANS